MLKIKSWWHKGNFYVTLWFAKIRVFCLAIQSHIPILILHVAILSVEESWYSSAKSYLRKLVLPDRLYSRLSLCEADICQGRVLSFRNTLPSLSSGARLSSDRRCPRWRCGTLCSSCAADWVAAVNWNWELEDIAIRDWYEIAYPYT